MSKFKVALVLFIALCVACPAEAFSLFNFLKEKEKKEIVQKEKKVQKTKKEKPLTQFDNTETGELDEDLPDILQPMPETKETLKLRKKIAKQEKRKAKHSIFRSKEDLYIPTKGVKKYHFALVERDNKAPKTWAEYIAMSKEIKREDKTVPAHSYKKDEKLNNIPDRGVRVVKYNSPPGVKNLDLRLLMTRRELVTPAILSPDKSRLIYSVIYSLPTSEQVASEMFYIKIPKGTSIENALTDFHTIEAERKPVLAVGTKELFQYERRTLALIDWSEDGQKIAVAEKVGAQTKGPWETRIWTYDFENNKAYELTALREAIRYHWKNDHNLDLIDYMWDLYPIGWDKYNKDRIIVYAYAYGEKHVGAKFLGAWSIDYKNQRSELMSETDVGFEVSANGYCLHSTIGRGF